MPNKAINPTKALPMLPKGISAPLRGFLHALQERVEVWQGLGRGDQLDRVLTARDIIDPVNINLALGSNGNWDPGLQPETPDEGTTDPCTTHTPSALTNLTATGAFSSIILEWDGTGQSCYSHTEIYRNTSDDLGTALLVGTSLADIYTDNVGHNTGTTYYYWVRAIAASSGKFGPYNATNGVSASTAPSWSDLDDTLLGNISETELNATLNNRIDYIDTDAVPMDGTNGGILGRIEGYVNNVMNPRYSGMQAELDFTNNWTDFARPSNTAFAKETTVVRRGSQSLKLTHNAATTVGYTFFGSAFDDYNIDIEPNNRWILSAWVYVDATNSPNTTNNVNIRLRTNAAGTYYNTVTYESVGTGAWTRISAVIDLTSDASDKALFAIYYDLETGSDAYMYVQDVQLELATGSNNTAPAPYMPVPLDGLYDQWTVKTDVNGYVSGFGYSVEAKDGTPYSNFIVNVDNFAIGKSGATTNYPFQVVGSTVYIKDAMIQNAAIDEAKIDSLAVTEGKIGNLAVTTGKIGNLQVTTGKIALLAVDTGQIANAAIENAKIGVAAVDTLEIDGNAVTAAVTATIADVSYGNTGSPPPAVSQTSGFIEVEANAGYSLVVNATVDPGSTQKDAYGVMRVKVQQYESDQTTLVGSEVTVIVQNFGWRSTGGDTYFKAPISCAAFRVTDTDAAYVKIKVEGQSVLNPGTAYRSATIGDIYCYALSAKR